MLGTGLGLVRTRCSLACAGKERFDDWLASGHLERLEWKLGAGAQVTLTHGLKRFVSNDLSRSTSWTSSGRSLLSPVRRHAEADDLCLRLTLLGQPSQGVLATTDGDLVHALLGHGHHR